MRRSRRQHAPRQSAEPGVHQSFAVSNLGSREARSAFNRSDVRASVCIGSNLARMEMAIALKTLLQRVPDFELDRQSTCGLVRRNGARTAAGACQFAEGSVVQIGMTPTRCLPST